MYQAKGFPYRIQDLVSDPGLAEKYRDGTYVTLRLKSSMYHRFHAPCTAGGEFSSRGRVKITSTKTSTRAIEQLRFPSCHQNRQRMRDSV